MKAYDTVKNVELEVDRDSLIQLMKDGRQIDFVFDSPVSDEDGYMSWDVEFWSSVSDTKFIRTYELKGRTLGEFTHYNIYDMATEFNPDKAAKVRIS